MLIGEIRSNFLQSVNRMFAISMAQDIRAPDIPPRLECRVRPMRTLRRIQAVSLSAAPQWVLCVFFGAYVTMQLAVSGGSVS